MRTALRRIALILMAPVACIALAAHSEDTNATINIGSVDSWKNYDSLPVKESGGFSKAGSWMPICPMMLLKERHPDMMFDAYIDQAQDGHSMLTAALKRDERVIQWVAIATPDGGEAGHVELRAPDETPSAAIKDVWRLFKHCEER